MKKNNTYIERPREIQNGVVNQHRDEREEQEDDEEVEGKKPNLFPCALIPESFEMTFLRGRNLCRL